MKYKNKFKFFHDTDPEVEKQVVKVNKKNINDITYKSFVKINGIKYNDVIVEEDGNGVTIITPRRNEELRLDYDEVTATFAALASVMEEMGFVDATKFKDR